MVALSPLTPLGDLIVEGMPERQAKALATTVKRANTLKADGYEFVRTDRVGVYHVFKPAKLNKQTGELTEFAPYIVDVQAETCTCEGFLYNGHCKHERACREAVREALDLLIGGQS